MTTDPLEAEIIKAQPKASRLGFDSLLEDVFGLNIRSLKTIGVLFSRPARYFDAARDRNWLGRFTPSFRVWFGLLAVMAFMRFFYGSEDSALIEGMTAQMDAEIAEIPDDSMTFNTRQYAIDTFKWLFVFMPFAFIPVYSAVAFTFRSFGGSPSFVVRLRYVLATVIPSTVLLLAMTPILMFRLTPNQMTVYTVIGLILMFGADYLKAYRGALVDRERGRAGVALGFATLLFVAYFVAMIIAMVPAVILSLANNMSFH